MASECIRYGKEMQNSVEYRLENQLQLSAVLFSCASILFRFVRLMSRRWLKTELRIAESLMISL